MLKGGYEIILVSSVGDRDGMSVELGVLDPRERIAEVFEDDETKQRTVTFFVRRPIPLEAVEWLLEQASERL